MKRSTPLALIVCVVMILPVAAQEKRGRMSSSRRARAGGCRDLQLPDGSRSFTIDKGDWRTAASVTSTESVSTAPNCSADIRRTRRGACAVAGTGLSRSPRAAIPTPTTRSILSAEGGEAHERRITQRRPAVSPGRRTASRFTVAADDKTAEEKRRIPLAMTCMRSRRTTTNSATCGRRISTARPSASRRATERQRL